MPGILFISDKNRMHFLRNRETLREMVAGILHEPYYRHVSVEVETLGLQAANVYMDHEDAAEKVYCSKDQSLIAMLNGEVFAQQELRQRLRACRNPEMGLPEIITQLYRQEGLACLKHINGHFSLLLVDKAQRQVVFANDRMNFHRSYLWHKGTDSVVVAPEVKCFAHHPDADLHLNQNTIAEFFKYDAHLGKNTFYQEVSRLPNASALIVNDGGLKVQEYWSPSSVIGLGKLSEKDYIEQSTDTFEKIVDEYVTPGKTGLSLTGGWDTRTILSVLHRKKIHIPCYTFGGRVKDTYDVRIANHIANRTNNQFHKIVIGDSFTKNIGYWANKAVFVSDGVSCVTTSYEYFANMEARRYGPIRLTGKYGSQIVRGATMLKDRRPDTRVFSTSFRQTIRKYAKEAKYDPVNQIVREEIPYVFSARQAQEQSALTIRTPYLDNRLVEIMLRAPKFEDSARLQKEIIGKNTPEFRGISTNRGDCIDFNLGKRFIKAQYKFLTLMDDVYNWERLPSYALPICKVGDILGLSRFFNGRAEYRHFRTWFLNEMNSFTKEILLDPATLQRPWYSPKFLTRMARLHYSGILNFTYEIDKIVSLELWLRQNRI